nr:maltose acetyltransferase domain-containing protein [Nocardia flavorosea]
MSTQKQCMLGGELYRDSDTELVAERRACQKLLDRFNETKSGDEMQQRVSIGPRAQLLTALHPMDDHELRRQRWETAAAITIGDNVWLGV